MRDYNFLKSKFLEKHTEIDSHEYLDKYINFLLEYDSNEIDDYKEMHHILPRSVFPEFENEDWNIVNLRYQDHVNVHLMLFKSINIRIYQRPLNWMLKTYKNKEEISNAAKRGWVKLKSNEEKYEKWRKNKSESMKKYVRSEKYKNIMLEYYNSVDRTNIKKVLRKKRIINYDCEKRKEFLRKHYSSEKQRERAKKFWDNITEEEYIEFSNKMKELWTEEKRLKKSMEMNEYYLNEDNILKKKEDGKKRWDSMPDEERSKFRYKMDLINKNEDKRKDAGNKIKNLWKDERYLEKMKNRPRRKGTSILIIKPNGEEITFEAMNDVVRAYNFSPHLIRRYRDTDMEIREEDLKEDKSLLNCKIKTIKNG